VKVAEIVAETDGQVKVLVEEGMVEMEAEVCWELLDEYLGQSVA
jgi:hypothetical protein